MVQQMADWSVVLMVEMMVVVRAVLWVASLVGQLENVWVVKSVESMVAWMVTLKVVKMVE